MSYEPFANSVAGRAFAELRRNGRTAERALADAIDTDVDTLRASVWPAEQDRQVRREKVMGLWWYELMVPVQPAPASAAPPPDQPPPKRKPRARAYAPQPGTYADRVIAYLREHGETRLAALAAHFDTHRAALKSCLTVSVDTGLIRAAKRGSQLWYRAGDVAPADPVDHALGVTAELERTEQAALDEQEREAQDLLLAPQPPLQLPAQFLPQRDPQPEPDRGLLAIIDELRAALAERSLELVRLRGLVEAKTQTVEQPLDLRVTLSVCATAHQAERISAFVRSMTEVRP